MFERPHHQRIAQVLNALNGPLLAENSCLFGGGTAIALRYGEYRESVDIDLLVSELEYYRNLRQMLIAPKGIAAIFQEGATVPEMLRPLRADQYGLRTLLQVERIPVKFEIVLEGRIQFERPGSGDQVCGIATLTPLDMLTSKLLANSDRWRDDAVFSRDLIDLAMVAPEKGLLAAAVQKAESAYGDAIAKDLKKAIQRMQSEENWMERCMKSLSIEIPKALLWQKIRHLKILVSVVEKVTVVNTPSPLQGEGRGGGRH